MGGNPGTSLPEPSTLRLKDSISLRIGKRNWLFTGLPKNGGGVVSVAISVAGGGTPKSLVVLMVHLPPVWHMVHCACANSLRPAAMSAAETPPLTFALVKGLFGVRTANFTHSLSAVSAGTWLVLPGSVTVT